MINKRKKLRENKCKVLEKPCSTWENISYILGELWEEHKALDIENLAS